MDQLASVQDEVWLLYNILNLHCLSPGTVVSEWEALPGVANFTAHSVPGAWHTAVPGMIGHFEIIPRKLQVGI